MDLRKLARCASLVTTLCAAVLCPAGMSWAATFTEFVDPNPAAGNQFGNSVVALSTGNVVITSPFDDAGGTDAGAVYLFNGATGVLISTLRGSSLSDQVGSRGVIALTNGNFVVASPNWNNGAVVDVGAVTWGSGTTGVSGVVSAANSLVGSTASDQIGNLGMTALTNGNYVVVSSIWNNGAVVDAGAVTWGSGTTGVSGVISAANSLVGSTATDNVGADGFGANGVVALTNGNYVVRSGLWDNGAVANAGAATWGNGTTGLSGAVSAANSLAGSTASDRVGSSGVTPLTNGSYVVVTRDWDNGAVVDAGAATWGSGTAGVSGVISAANSLVGSTASDGVGASPGVTALTNGNYVVSTSSWNNGALNDAGAATWGSGTTGVAGVISVANSLIGSTANDRISNSVTALTNGNYVVASANWDNGAAFDAGAATWANGTTGLSGVVSLANSLVGSIANDRVPTAVTALTNGNYVVASGQWDNGAVANVGAATWGNGTTGVTGAVSAANSLVGSVNSDGGQMVVTALTNGNYVVSSWVWDNGAVTDAGAATWGSGTTGVTGPITAANSLVGSTASDLVGGGLSGGGVTALANGNYVVGSPNWNNGAGTDVGAATWGSGTTGMSGVVSATNSLIGFPSDQVGIAVTALANGNYVVVNPNWDSGALANPGAASWGSGTAGVTGQINVATSLIGTTTNAGLQSIVVDNVVTNTFIARFLTEGGGRVRVGPPDFPPLIVSLVDIPNDQGGWVRLTFNRSGPDVADGPVETYGIWRHVPGTLIAGAGKVDPSAEPGARLATLLRTAVPAGLDVREVEGRFYVVAPETRAAGIAAAFPPGTWELVLSVPAVQQVQYVVAVPTISNAAPNDFVVTVHTTTPSTWFISAPASGQSLDNLAPSAPTLLTGSYSGGQTNLAWAANSEIDLGGYRVYRGASAGFTPSIGNRIATPASPSHADVGTAGSYYKVSAVDVNGNESGYALITPGQTTGLDGENTVVFALEGAWPNPASGNRLHIAFALPTGAAARIELLDVSGRRLLAREVGSLGAGRHTVNLAQSRRVAPGLYWVRLAQGPNQRTTRVAVVE